MPSEVFSRVSARLGKVGCPICLNSRFSVVLRCDLAPGDTCTVVGECQHCSNRFDIENMPTLEEMEAAAQSKLNHQHGKCDGTPILRFLCDLESEDCWFEAECPACDLHWRLVPAGPPVATA